MTFIVATVLTKAYYRWNVQFFSRGVGSFSMCDATFGGFQSYESYDGEKLVFSKIRFESESLARECFETTLQNEEITVESREDLFDESGANIVGQKVTAKNESDPLGSGFLLSLDEDWIVEIASTSLRHALIFEKRARKY